VNETEGRLRLKSQPRLKPRTKLSIPPIAQIAQLRGQGWSNYLPPRSFATWAASKVELVGSLEAKWKGKGLEYLLVELSNSSRGVRVRVYFYGEGDAQLVFSCVLSIKDIPPASREGFF
jgi:hypothetical protein